MLHDLFLLFCLLIVPFLLWDKVVYFCLSTCWPVQQIFSYCFYSNSAISCLFYLNLLCCPSFQCFFFLYLLHFSLPLFTSPIPLSNPSLQSSFLLPSTSHFCCCSYHSLSPLSPLLCAPDLLSLCLITKSTGSSRRSCRRSSPSVRSSLTRVRGTSWHGEIFVHEFICVHFK